MAKWMDSVTVARRTLLKDLKDMVRDRLSWRETICSLDDENDLMAHNHIWNREPQRKIALFV